MNGENILLDKYIIRDLTFNFTKINRKIAVFVQTGTFKIIWNAVADCREVAVSFGVQGCSTISEEKLKR